MNKSKRHISRVRGANGCNEVVGRGLLLSLLAVVSALSTVEMKAQHQNGVPKVVVSILIDQLRTDYLNAFMPLYGEDGFCRLLNEGRVYHQASYPMARPDRASAAATIAAGAPPSQHGIVARKWIDRKTLRPVFCVDDTSCTMLEGVGNGMSPAKMAVSTIGDELKIATEGKALVYSIAPYSEMAILAAGHAADGAMWIDDNTGNWSSSSYYGELLPGWASFRNKFYHIAGSLDEKAWEPSSDFVGNFSYFLSGGMKTPFSHKLKGDERFAMYKTSGLVNEEVANMAVTCVERSMVGGDGITDYLSVAFYAGNYQHLPVSEVSMELQDTYVRLDKSLALLINAIEKKVGKENALFVLTSTGYIDEENVDLSKYRIPTGTFDMDRAMTLLNMYLVAVYGPGQYVEAGFGTQLYLNHRLIESKQINQAELLERSQDLLIQLSGVKDVYTSQRMLQGAWTPGISRIRAGYYPQYSGDIAIEVAPGWTFIHADKREQQLVRESYVPFPIIFLGGKTEAQTIDRSVTVDYIAPTLAKCMRIRAPNACSLPPLF